MTEVAAPSLLERKIAAARPRADPLVMTPERALSLAFARVAEQMLKLPLRNAGLTQGLLSGAEIADTLPDMALLATLSGPKDAVGLAVLDPGALAALIEMLTLGRLGTSSVAPRRPTRTDAAMVSGFIDAALAQVETLLAAEEAVIWAGGFRYASHLPDARPLGLMLDAPAYRVFRLTLGFGLPVAPDAAERLGDVVMIFPAKGQGAAPVVLASQSGSKDAIAATGLALLAAADQWEQALERVVMHAITEIEAVLGRVSLPLADVLALEVGVSLPLPMAALQMVQVEGAGGAILCRGQLGKGNGRRALRLYPAAAEGEVPHGLPVTATEAVPASAQPFERTPVRHAGPGRVALDAGAAILPDETAGPTSDNAGGQAGGLAAETRPPMAG